MSRQQFCLIEFMTRRQSLSKRRKSRKIRTSHVSIALRMAIGWNALPIKSDRMSASMTKYRSIFLKRGSGYDSGALLIVILVKLQQEGMGDIG